MTKQRLVSLLPEIPEVTEVQEIVSQELLSEIRPEVMRYLKPILPVIPEQGEFNSAQIRDMVQRALGNVGLAAEGWVPILNTAVKTFSVQNSKRQVVVPDPHDEHGKEFTKSAADLRRLFAHEIGVHAMRRDLSLGTDFEEGLGILLECVVTGETNGVAMMRAKDRYVHVGLAHGVDAIDRNARQVFEITWRLEAVKLAKDGIITPEIEAKSKSNVRPHIDNIYRGTDHKLPGVYYNKAKVYLEGIVNAAKYAEAHAHEPGWLRQLISNGPPALAA